MLVSPKSRYQNIYRDILTLVRDVEDAGYQVTGFGRLHKGDYHLTRGGVIGEPIIELWTQVFRSTGAYIKLNKI